MSRALLWTVSVFLTFAMVAMIWVQRYWIKRSMESEEYQLGLVVNQVLSEISDELVQNETVISILNEIRPPVMQYQSQAYWNYRIDNRSAYDRAEDQDREAGPEADQASDVRENPGNLQSAEAEGEYTYTSPDRSLKNQQVLRINDTLLAMVGTDEGMQDTILISAMNPDLVRFQLMEIVARQESFVDHVVKKMLMEEKHVLNKISKKQIETMLDQKFLLRGVDVPFQYAIYEEGHQPYLASEAFHEFEPVRYFRRPLFPESVFNRSTYISVYFPEEKKLIRESMGIMGASSLLITLFIISMFSLTLFIIFKQKRLAEMKNDFVSNMTHELKTPISTISLASQMLSDRSIPDQHKNLGQISRIIDTESKQLGFQVERVLQMAIFDHGQLKLKSEEVDLHDVIETVAQNFLIQVDRRKGNLEFLPEADQSVVRGDQMHLTNVITNLLENAMKYTQETPEIGISTRNENRHLVLSVRDNGIGISKEDQKRIFDKFFRVPTGNVHNVKGFGLGLSYVKLIVEEHGGHIRLKSELEKGSQFDIHLPLHES